MIMNPGFRFNSLCPAPLNTPLLQDWLGDDKEKRYRREVHFPTGRFGEAIEQAQMVVFLASDDSSFVNAQEMIVDGGMTRVCGILDVFSSPKLTSSRHTSLRKDRQPRLPRTRHLVRSKSMDGGHNRHDSHSVMEIKNIQAKAGETSIMIQSTCCFPSTPCKRR